MKALENISIAIAVVLFVMGCMVFGDWLARSKPSANDYYCQKAKPPNDSEMWAGRSDALAKQKDARKTANERYHELCNQWRAVQVAEEAAHVAWLQLWLGLAGLGGLLATLKFAAQSAIGATEAARHMARDIDMQTRMEKASLHCRDVLSDYRVPNQAPIKIKNYGKSRAILLDAIVEGKSGTKVLPATPVYGTKIILLDGDVIASNDEDVVLGWIDGDGLKGLFEGNGAIVWGYIRYTDVFGRTWRQGFGFASQYTYVDDDDTEEPIWRRSGGDAYNYDREEK